VQPPVPIPNLQAEARQVANDVMNGINGLENSSILNTSGTSTPAEAERAASAQSKSNNTSAKQLIPPRASSHNRTSESSNSADQRNEGSASRIKKSLERSSEPMINVDTNTSDQRQAGNEVLSPKSLPARPRTNSITEGMGRVSRRDQDHSENQPFPADEDHRSSIVLRSGTFADGTSFIAAGSNEKDVNMNTQRMESVSLSKHETDNVKR
jgi:hypothetical protein